MEGLLFTYIFNLFTSAIQVYNTKTGGLFVCLVFLTMDMCHKTSYCRNPPYVMKLEMPATRTCFQQTNSNLSSLTRSAVLMLQGNHAYHSFIPVDQNRLETVSLSGVQNTTIMKAGFIIARSSYTRLHVVAN